MERLILVGADQFLWANRNPKDVVKRLWEYEVACAISETECKSPEELYRDLADLAAYRKAEADGELVRVVRCKDCKYLGDSFGTSGVNCKKGVFMGLHSKKRFCSCGERRYAE